MSEKERIIQDTVQGRCNRVKQWKKMPLLAGKRNFLAVRVVILSDISSEMNRVI